MVRCVGWQKSEIWIWVLEAERTDAFRTGHGVEDQWRVGGWIQMAYREWESERVVFPKKEMKHRSN